MKKVYEISFWNKDTNQYWGIDYDGRYVYGYHEALKIAKNECRHEYGSSWKEHIQIRLRKFDLQEYMSRFWLPFKNSNWEDFILALKDEKIINLDKTSLLDYAAVYLNH